MRNFTEEDEKDICYKYDTENISMTNIAKMYHCSQPRIKKILEKNNIKIVRKRRININLKENFFEDIDSEEKAYFLGLLFTDGSVTDEHKRQSQVRLELQERDLELLEKYKNILGIGSKTTFSTKKNKNNTISKSALVSFRSQKMVDDLKKYGIIKNKTYLTKHLPDIRQELIPHFLRGLIDGDGSIYTTKTIINNKTYFKKVIYFCSHNYSVVEDFKNLLNAILINKYDSKITDNKGTYRFTITKKDTVKEVATLLYKDSNISLARKYKLAKNIYEGNDEEDIVQSDH